MSPEEPESKKEKKKRLIAQNTPVVMALLREHLPDVYSVNMLSHPMRRWVNVTSVHAHFSEAWVKKQLKKMFRPAPGRGQKLNAEDIRQMRATADSGKQKERNRQLAMGHWYPDMTPKEKDIFDAAISRINREEEQSRLDHEADIARSKAAWQEKGAQRKDSQGHLKVTPERLWLAGLDETLRMTFASWCARRGVLPVQQHWESFEADTGSIDLPADGSSTSISEKPEPEVSAKSARDCSSEKNKLLSAGWTEVEVDSLTRERMYTEYKAELARDKTSQGHFDGVEAKDMPSYAWVRIRPAQGRFRAEVLANWGDACAITGSKLVVEACHIIAHSKGGAATTENGIALSVDLHRLMDSGHLIIADGVVLLSDEARLESRYQDLHETKIRASLVPVIFHQQERDA